MHRSQAIIEFDPAGNILQAHANFLVAMNYQAEELVGRHRRMFVDWTYGAQEVRVLTQLAAEAAKNIKALISRSVNEVHAGAAQVYDTGVSLQAIIANVQQIGNHVISICDALREQAIALAEINSALNSIDQGAQYNAAMVEETSVASIRLGSQAEQLRTLLSDFRHDEEQRSSQWGCNVVPMRVA